MHIHTVYTIISIFTNIYAHIHTHTLCHIDVLGGVDSAAFKSFEELFIKGFVALQKHVDGMYAIIQAFYGSDLRRKGMI